MSYKSLTVCAAGPLRGSVPVPSDDGVLLGRIAAAALSRGTSTFELSYPSASVRAFLGALPQFGVGVETTESSARVSGLGLGEDRFVAPEATIDTRGEAHVGALLIGLSLGRPSAVRLLVDSAVADTVGAQLVHLGLCERADEGGASALTLLPRSGRFPGFELELSGALTWVKQCFLLAGLRAGTPSIVSEVHLSADHLERALLRLRAPLESHSSALVLHPPRDADALAPSSYELIGSSYLATHVLAAALLAPQGGRVTVRDVSLNPTSMCTTALLDLLGVSVEQTSHGDRQGEPFGEVTVESPGTIRGGRVLGGELALRARDSALPILAVLARAEKTSHFCDIALERRDSSPRCVSRSVGFLRAFGRDAEVQPEGVRLGGGAAASHAPVKLTTGGDYRLALLGSILGLSSTLPSAIDDVACLGEIFPRWAGTLRALGAEARIADATST